MKINPKFYFNKFRNWIKTNYDECIELYKERQEILNRKETTQEGYSLLRDIMVIILATLFFGWIISFAVEPFINNNFVNQTNNFPSIVENR